MQVPVDGVPWVIKPGDYMSSFSFLRTSVSTKVLMSDKVLTLAKVLTALKMLTMGGWGGGAKDFKYTDKNLKYDDKRLIFEKRLSNSTKDFKYRQKISTKIDI